MKRKARYRSAIGLEYDWGRREAPSVAVKGENWAADEIVKIARRFGVPVVNNPGLARALRELEPEDSIPERLFEAVAVLLNALDKRMGKAGM